MLGAAARSGSLSEAAATLTGWTAGERAGYALAGGQDADGDGLPDVIVGAFGNDSGGTDAGAVYLLVGDTLGTVSLSTADSILIGEAAGDCAGAAVSSPGDVDGDGISDVLVGAYASDASGSAAGASYLVLGGVSGTRSLSTADARLLGESADDGAGIGVAGAGDVDGDGLADLLVGAWGVDDSGGQSGIAYVLLGAPSGDVDLGAADARLVGQSGGDEAGYAVAGAGDTDADGFADVLVGAPSRDASGTDSGAAYLVRGPVSGTLSLSAANAVFTGEAASDAAGIAVAGVGDTNGDGFDDVGIAANRADGGASDGGAVYLLVGGGF